MPTTARTKLKNRATITPPVPITPIQTPRAEKKEERQPMPRQSLTGTSNVLLNFDTDTLQRLDAHVQKLVELHSFIPKDPKVTPDDLKKAMRISREKGAKAANEFLSECKRRASRRRTPPSRRSFVYNLIYIGLERYEERVEHFQDLILHGIPVIEQQSAQ